MEVSKNSVVKYTHLDASDFLSDADFQSYNAEERGVYCTIIFYLYCNKGKAELDTLRMLTNCRNFEKVWSKVGKKFVKRTQRLQGKNRCVISHKRVIKELKKATAAMQTYRNKGIKGATARWHKHNSSYASSNPTAMPEADAEKKRKEKKDIKREEEIASQYIFLLGKRNSNKTETVIAAFKELIEKDGKDPADVRRAIETYYKLGGVIDGADDIGLPRRVWDCAKKLRRDDSVGRRFAG